MTVEINIRGKAFHDIFVNAIFINFLVIDKIGMMQFFGSHLLTAALAEQNSQDSPQVSALLVSRKAIVAEWDRECSRTRKSPRTIPDVLRQGHPAVADAFRQSHPTTTDVLRESLETVSMAVRSTQRAEGTGRGSAGSIQFIGLIYFPVPLFFCFPSFSPSSKRTKARS